MKTRSMSKLRPYQFIISELLKLVCILAMVTVITVTIYFVIYGA